MSLQESSSTDASSSISRRSVCSTVSPGSGVPPGMIQSSKSLTMRTLPSWVKQIPYAWVIGLYFSGESVVIHVQMTSFPLLIHF